MATVTAKRRDSVTDCDVSHRVTLAHPKGESVTTCDTPPLGGVTPVTPPDAAKIEVSR
jgi:hypothetical protein